jgi:hypothetical protein
MVVDITTLEPCSCCGTVDISITVENSTVETSMFNCFKNLFHSPNVANFRRKKCYFPGTQTKIQNNVNKQKTPRPLSLNINTTLDFCECPGLITNYTLLTDLFSSILEPFFSECNREKINLKRPTGQIRFAREWYQ